MEANMKFGTFVFLSYLNYKRITKQHNLATYSYAEYLAIKRNLVMITNNSESFGCMVFLQYRHYRTVCIRYGMPPVDYREYLKHRRTEYSR